MSALEIFFLGTNTVMFGLIIGAYVYVHKESKSTREAINGHLESLTKSVNAMNVAFSATLNEMRLEFSTRLVAIEVQQGIRDSSKHE